jgi:Ca-activated chloride channel family protein
MHNASFAFAAPYHALWLLVPWLAWGAWWWLKPKAGNEPESGAYLYHPSAAWLKLLMEKTNAAVATPQRNWRWVSWLAVWLLLTLAMMQPTITRSQTRVKSEGIDLVLAVDLSLSMKALDMSRDWRDTRTRVNRLDVVRTVLRQFVDERMETQPGDRLGLVWFGESAYVASPLTGDGSALLETLEDMQIGLAGDSTAIGDAVALGVKMLRTSAAQSRVLILLTDGENTAGSIQPLDAARLAKDYGVHFYAIAIGKSDKVPFPQDGPFGTMVIEAEMKVDVETLKDMARITQGSFFRVTEPDVLKEVYARINKIERTESESTVLMQHEPLYRWPLGMALAMMIILLIPRSTIPLDKMLKARPHG